jgi:hypothetical protein
MGVKNNMHYFHDLFPDQAKSDTIVIDTSDYTALSCRACALFEAYCSDPKCDCKDALIYVEQQKSMTSMKFDSFSVHLAVVRYSLAKPTSKKNPHLVPELQQSPHAKAILALVHEYMKLHPEYVTQLRKHYDIMKEAGKKLQSAVSDNVPVRREAEPGRNEPCPCGSGEKYKKCCLLKNK